MENEILKQGTRITIENYNKRQTWESPRDDEDINDIVGAFASLLIGMTFHPITVYSTLKEVGTDLMEAFKLESDVDKDEDDIRWVKG